ncbi:MAG: segregation/condensation protein A [Bdellovibrionales bacterium]|nr:segregation/condensation protein A [Bdellovibrionales bacterium]
MSANEASFLKRGSTVQIDCKVHLPEFEGPLDLLLHLIKNQELDILNLPIATITRQYLAYLDYMREMNLDLASDYLVMAATLTYLKSQVILPQETNGEATGPDPRQQLIRRLVELANYKDLAKGLSERPRLFRDVFPVRNTGAEEIADGIEPEVALSNPFQLTEAYRLLLERRKVVVHNVFTDETPISVCLDRIVASLSAGDRVTFQQLLPQVARPQDVISMFLGVLESARIGISGIEQEEIFGPLAIHRRMDPTELEAAKKNYNMTWEKNGSNAN